VLEQIHAAFSGRRLNADDLISRLLKQFHIWPQLLRVLAMLPTYRQKMQNQTNMRVILSIVVVFHNLTNGIKHNAHRATSARTTL